MVTAELILTTLGGFTFALFGVVLGNYNKRIDKAEAKAEHIENNYNEKFNKAYDKIDSLQVSLSEMHATMKEQMMYCKMVQENKKKNFE